MEEHVTAKTKTEGEQFEETMNRGIARWDNIKNEKVAELRSEALEENANSELEDDAVLSDVVFSDDDSCFDSGDKNKFYCIDDDVLLPNIREWHSTSVFFGHTPKNELTFRKLCSKELITCKYITSGP